MQLVVNPGEIKGTIKAVPSKSMMQRVCAAALLHKGTTVIHNPGVSEDDKAALGIIQQLGARVIEQEASIIVHSGGLSPVTDNIFCGESGLSTRLFTPIAALSEQPIRIDGKGSLLQRPMNELGHILPELGVHVRGFIGKVPFEVQGPLQARSIKIDGYVSSQYLSGLLFAYCFSAKEDVVITVDELRSKPYVDMTLQVLERFGRPVINQDYKEFYIRPASFFDEAQVDITIEGDWSSAAIFLVAGAIAGEVTVAGLNVTSVQADKFILRLLEDAGADVCIEDGKIRCRRSILKPIETDLRDCPDIFPAAAILASCCEEESYLSGLHRLWHKESNRAESIAEMLLQFDVFFSIEDDMLCIAGEKPLWGCYIDSYNDHRIVMAAAIGALRADSRVMIDNAEAVNKSYPGFFDALDALGVEYYLKND
ncbi:MAG: 3-phosphoshikimate 1-carboxyvinyltransferase [Bacteroidetes bacterium]|nr:3-phosphoshikimate 1-carboxyvinyltransferase [Bacteroidota bacterium]